MKNLKTYKLFVNESIRDKMLPKSEEEINSVKNELNEIYINQQKVKYKILKYLESIGFNFSYNTERIKEENFEPELFAIIGIICIDDFIKEHKKSLPNFNSLSYSKQDEVWDKNMNMNIKPNIIKILEEFNFSPLKDITYGNGDMRIDFKTPYDDKFAYSKKYPKIVLDTMTKQIIKN